ncbi:MAG: hypothetical protein R6U31_06355 [bacterium]
MKYILILSAIIFALTSCSTGPLGIYTVHPVVKIDGMDNTLNFKVPDTDNNGWNSPGNDEAEDTLSINPEVYLSEGDQAYITGYQYTVYPEYSENDNAVLSYSAEYIMPVAIESDTVELDAIDIIIDERDAHQIDLSDDDTDQSGSGVIELRISYEDIRGDNYKAVPAVIPFTVTKP